MSKITTLYINSRNRLNNGSSSSTNFEINLFPLGIGETTSWCVKDITIPFSYIVTVPFPDNGDSFQSFELLEDGGSGVLSASIDIPAGNYTKQQLQTELKNKLDTLSPYSNVYTVDISEITGKTRISALGVAFVINWATSNVSQSLRHLRIGNILGWFNTNNYNTENAISPVGTVKESPQHYNLSGPSCIYLKSTSLTIGSTNFFNNNKDHVILEIPVISNPNGIIRYQSELDIFQPFPDTNINVLDFKLVDPFNNEIDLQGLDFCFSIVLKNFSNY